MFTALLPMLVLMGSMIFQAEYCGDFRPWVPLILGTACSIVLGMSRGRSWDDLSHETFQAVGSVASVIALYILIGPTISTWLAAGTLPTLIIWGSSVMTPAIYLPLSFLLMGLSGMLLGSGISALGTMGIALVSIGLSMGYPLWFLASVLGSAAFWGNAVSPLSAVTVLSLAITKGKSSEYSHFLFPRMLPPFLFCAAVYAVGGYFFQPTSTAEAVSFESLAQLFPPGLLGLIPPLVLAAMILLKAPTLVMFFASIFAACIIAIGTGHITLAQLPSLIIDGYRYTGTDVLLKGILNRGGINSITSIIITVTLAMAFGGSYQASGALDQVLNFLTRFVDSTEGLRRMTLCSTMLTTVATGSCTMGTALTATLFTPKLKSHGLHAFEQTTVLGPTGTVFSVLVPWSVAGFAMLNLLELPLSEPGTLLYIPASFCSYLTLLWLAKKVPSSTRNS